MFYEKPFFSKLNVFADWFIRLVVLNLLIIIMSLPIVTLFHAFSAGFNTLSDYKNRKDVKIFSTYFRYFKQEFVKKLILELIVIAVIVFCYYNGRYYISMYDYNGQLFYLIGYYVVIALSVSCLAINLFALQVFRVVPKYKLSQILKLAFLLAGKFFYITILVIAIMLSPILLLFNYLTALVLVFVGVSLPLYITVVIMSRSGMYLERLVKQNG